MYLVVNIGSDEIDILFLCLFSPCPLFFLILSQLLDSFPLLLYGFPLNFISPLPPSIRTSYFYATYFILCLCGKDYLLYLFSYIILEFCCYISFIIRMLTVNSRCRIFKPGRWLDFLFGGYSSSWRPLIGT